jgi:hypothetical protein
VIGVEYGYQANRTDLHMYERDHLVEEAVRALDRAISGQYSRVVFIGKSIGTLVQTEVVQKVSFPVRNHVFLTPLKPIIPAIQQSQHALVTVGDNDSLFDSSDIAQIKGLHNVALRVVQGADHMLETEDFSTSIDVLRDVVNWCGEFCGELV